MELKADTTWVCPMAVDTMSGLVNSTLLVLLTERAAIESNRDRLNLVAIYQLGTNSPNVIVSDSFYFSLSIISISDQSFQLLLF